MSLLTRWTSGVYSAIFGMRGVFLLGLAKTHRLLLPPFGVEGSILPTTQCREVCVEGSFLTEACFFLLFEGRKFPEGIGHADCVSNFGLMASSFHRETRDHRHWQTIGSRNRYIPKFLRLWNEVNTNPCGLGVFEESNKGFPRQHVHFFQTSAHHQGVCAPRKEVFIFLQNLKKVMKVWDKSLRLYDGLFFFCAINRHLDLHGDG